MSKHNKGWLVSRAKSESQKAKIEFDKSQNTTASIMEFVAFVGMMVTVYIFCVLIG